MNINFDKKPLAIIMAVALILAAMPTVLFAADGADAAVADGDGDVAGEITPDEFEVEGAPGIVGISADILPDEFEVEGAPDIIGISAEIDADDFKGAEEEGVIGISAETDGTDAAFGTGSGEPLFSCATGEITDVNELNGSVFFRLLDADGGETEFIVEDGFTVFSSLEALSDAGILKTGAQAEIYFSKPPVMTLQYPPRFTATVVVVRGDGDPSSAFVGAVDGDGLASDSSVRLNIADDARIVRQSDGAVMRLEALSAESAGRPFANRVIIAYYAVTTRSMPPIALVTNVAVLDKIGAPFFVNGQALYSAGARVKPDGTVLLPLRAIAESLGYEVNWDGDAKSARIGVAIYAVIGSDEYTVGRMAPIKLDAPAELYKSRTYAPVSFYEQILHMTYSEANGLIMLEGEPGGD